MYNNMYLFSQINHLPVLTEILPERGDAYESIET